MGGFCSRETSSLSEAFRYCRAKQRDQTVSGYEVQATAVRFAKKLLEDNKGKQFKDAYELLRTVSYGATSTVELVRSKATGETLAAKVMPKNKSSFRYRTITNFRERVLHEVAIMKIVDGHPNAPRLIDVFEDDRCFYLIMEYYSGGELFDHIVDRQKGFTEREAADIMKEIMDFLSHCHSIGLVHADVKPENIVFSESDRKLKVLDFGMSAFCRSNESRKNVFGTINYCSPEMANKWCGQKTDVWSAGVMLYFMLSGHSPFAYANKEAVLHRLRRHPRVTFCRQVWDDVSDEAKHFIKRLLSPHVGDRPTAKEALQHVWLSDLSFSSKSGFVLDTETVMLLKSFSQRSMMKRILWEHIAKYIPEDQIAKQREQFQRMDLDRNGRIDKYELARGIGKVNPKLKDEELTEIFTALDVNQSGEIDLTEFIAGTFMSLDGECRTELIKQSFMHLDKLGKGYIPREDLLEFLMTEMSANTKSQISKDELNLEISSMDLDGDGQISVEEFQSALTSIS